MSDLKLLHILKTSILLENRIDDAKILAQKKGELENFDDIVNLSTVINPNHKYLNWIVNNYNDIQNNTDQAIKFISYFDRNNDKFTKKDINQYTGINELEEAVKQALQHLRRDIEIVQGTRVLYEDYAFIVLIPETKAASCYYGLGTTWCTANNQSEYYQTYRVKGELYYIISRTKPTSDPTYKMAVRMVFNNDDGTFPPAPKIAEIRNAVNDLINSETLIENSSSNVLTAIQEDFNQKWDVWWNNMSEQIKQKYKEESEKRAYERIQAAERQRLENQREAARRLARRNEREQRRENDEYANNEEVYALREYLIEVGEWDGGDPEEAERLNNEINRVNRQIELLEAQLVEFPDNEEMYEQLTEFRNLLDELEDGLNEVTGYDIYELHQEAYDQYGLNVYTNEHNDRSYAIGTDDEADEAARNQVESFIDEFRDEPGMGFAAGIIERFIDGDQVAKEFESDVEDMIRESPDSYLDDDDMELTDEGLELLDEKQEALHTAEQRKSTVEDRITDIELEMEDVDSDSDEYSELEAELSDLQSEMEDLETEISDLESEIEDIEDSSDYKDYSEDAIQKAVENYLDDIRRDPIGELRNLGITDFSSYIDEDELIEYVIDLDGRGHGLAGYDGAENEITYNGTTYYIYRID